METLQRTANRGSISTGYDIDNSLKLEPDNSERIRRSGTTATDRKKFTVSFWVKRTEITSTYMVLACDEASGNDISFLDFESDDVLRFRDTASAADQCILETNRVFRDTSAWYHIVLAVDTTLATADNRNRIYVNGVEETSFSARTNFDLNDTPHWGSGTLTFGNALGEANYYAGYVAEAIYVDGQQLTPTEFGEFDTDTGIWKPIEYTGTFGNNGYYLKFNNSADLGEDANGGTSFTLYNITSADQATDTPTNNFATLNPLLNLNSTLTYTDGATEAASSAINSLAEGTIGFTNGKWYYEIVMPSASPNANANMMMGFGRPGYWGYGQTDPGMDTYSFAYNRTGVVFYNGTTTSGWSAYAKDDIVMVAIDTTNGFAYFGVNGTWGNGGVPTSGSSGTGAFDYDSLVTNVAIGDLLIPAFSTGNAGNIIQLNFGGYTEVSIASGNTDANDYGNFEYAPPTGYYALCSKNLAEFG